MQMDDDARKATMTSELYAFLRAACKYKQEALGGIGILDLLRRSFDKRTGFVIREGEGRRRMGRRAPFLDLPS